MDFLTGFLQTFTDIEDEDEALSVPASGHRDVHAADDDCAVSHTTFSFIGELVKDPCAFRATWLACSRVHTAEIDSFRMTRQQIRHARSIIRALPEFDQLRFELCPSTLPDHHFWFVYFTLMKEKQHLGHQKEEKNTSCAAKDAAALASVMKTARPPYQERGTKRERDDDEAGDDDCKVDGANSIGGDVALVTNMLLSGARSSLRAMEELIDNIDQQAANAFSKLEQPDGDSTESSVRINGKQEFAIADVVVGASIGDGEHKRARRSDCAAEASTLPHEEKDTAPVEQNVIEDDEWVALQSPTAPELSKAPPACNGATGAEDPQRRSPGRAAALAPKEKICGVDQVDWFYMTSTAKLGGTGGGRVRAPQPSSAGGGGVVCCAPLTSDPTRVKLSDATSEVGSVDDLDDFELL